MLKLTYTATVVTLEHSDEPLELSIRRRVLLGLRASEPIGVEPTAITLRVESTAPPLHQLRRFLAQRSGQPPLRLIENGTLSDIHLQGYWLGPFNTPGEGSFLCSLEQPLESILIELWQCQSEACLLQLAS